MLAKDSNGFRVCVCRRGLLQLHGGVSHWHAFLGSLRPESETLYSVKEGVLHIMASSRWAITTWRPLAAGHASAIPRVDVVQASLNFSDRELKCLHDQVSGTHFEEKVRKVE